MKTKKILGIVMLSLCLFSFAGCENEDERKITGYKEYVLTLASHKIPGVLTAEGENYLTNVYAVKTEQSDEWESLGSIGGFDFEEGYEYKIRISETDYLDYRMGQPAWSERNLLELLSKEKKDSEALPLHFIPEWYYKDRFMPEYKYAIEADSKEVIEADLKANPILPLNDHYLLYDAGFSKWIVMDDGNNTKGQGYIKKTDVEDPNTEFPLSYKMLRPEGQICGTMKWNFMNELDDENIYHSFDVFIVQNASLKTDIIRNIAPYLYKDLTDYYVSKYPEAGVKTVVVSFALSLQ